MHEDLDETFIMKAANEIKDFVEYCSLEVSFGNNGYTMLNASSTSLSLAQRKAMMEIYAQNMKSYYEMAEGWGWNDNEKSMDLFKQSSRFLVMVQSSNHENVAAFVMFRFEWDDEDEPEHPVLFLYELQIATTAQRQGLGRFLMQAVVNVAAKTKMWKTMLTCFKSNVPAMRFYTNVGLGFGVDCNSPSAHGHDSEPYEILSDKPRLRN